MAKKQTAADPEVQETSPETTTATPAAERPPQGITKRMSGRFHERFKAVELVDPDSLRVPKKRIDGEDYLDDPYLAIPTEKGGVHISQVAAETAALMLSCHPDSGGPSLVRLATDDEVEAHRKINGPGGHGNLIGRR